MASDQRATASGPAARISITALMIATVLLLLMVIGAAITALVITRQPPDQPLQLPSVSRA